MDSQTMLSSTADTVAIIKGIPTKTELLEMLSKDVYCVTFVKLDGQTRTVSCTLNPDFFSQHNQESKLDQAKINNLERPAIAVWDMISESWKSFRYERVQSVQLAKFYGNS
jgi:hypothetical protein